MTKLRIEGTEKQKSAARRRNILLKARKAQNAEDQSHIRSCQAHQVIRWKKTTERWNVDHRALEAQPTVSRAKENVIRRMPHAPGGAGERGGEQVVVSFSGGDRSTLGSRSVILGEKSQQNGQSKKAGRDGKPDQINLLPGQRNENTECRTNWRCKKLEKKQHCWFNLAGPKRREGRP